jgi:hypothetical protein
MNQAHILAAPPHRRIHWLAPLVIAVAATLVVLALVLPGNDDTTPSTVAGDVSASPASAARPDESSIAAAIAQPSESMPYQARPDESTVAASIAAGYQDKPSLSQIKRDAEFSGR